MDKPSESENKNDNPDNTPDIKKPTLWGVIYFILGITGLAFSIYGVVNCIDTTVPLFGTVIAGVLVGALSIFIIIYGVRVMEREV